MTAVRQAPEDMVRLLITKGAAVDARNAQGWTPLRYAVLNARRSVVAVLLDAGANPNALVDRASPLLHVAAGDAEIAGLLIAKGADLEAVDAKGQTALQLAVRTGNRAVAKLLTQKGARLGDLYTVAALGDLGKVKESIAKSGNLKEADDGGVSALHWAAYGGSAEVVRLLIEKGLGVNAKTKAGWTPLHWAVTGGSVEAARLLIDKGADIDAGSFDDQTPLELATVKTREGDESAVGRAAIADLLQQHGARVLPPLQRQPAPPASPTLPPPSPPPPARQITKTDSSSILAAAFRGDLAEGERLLTENPELLDAKDSFGQAPLLIAAREGRDEFVKMLLAQGADPNTGDRRQRTALHQAAERGHAAAVRLLLARGASLDALDSDGLTPWHLAVRNGSREVVDLFIAKGARADDLRTAAALGELGKMREFLAQGAVVNEQDSRGFTPLHAAALFGEVAVAELLLDAGARPNAKARDGQAPLYKAVERGHLKVVELLLTRGANPNATCSSGTPLHEAVIHGKADVAAFLIANGADVNAVASNRQTPLALAAGTYKNDEIAKLLREHGAELPSAKADTRPGVPTPPTPPTPPLPPPVAAPASGKRPVPPPPVPPPLPPAAAQPGK
jgi:ankyrin repeat protein